MGKSLLKSGKAKRRVVRTPKTLDQKYMGGEPTWNDQEDLSQEELQ